MNFRRGIRRDEPEINFVPLIDVLLVVLIFLMVTTTYSKFTELQVDLPSATGEAATERPSEIDIGISANGRYRILGEDGARLVAGEELAAELRRVAAQREDPILVVHADAGAKHQDVIAVLAAAREAGVVKVTFAAQAEAGAAASMRRAR
ncbi:MAG: biopolymer transporter ExbD [Burkholderiaceae bacterium]|nr:biopolymer transporter ExbD [Burkholderiaceae bacterium]